MTRSATRTTIAWLVALVMGFACSVLISLIMSATRFDPAGADPPGGGTILLGLLLGWVLATWLLLRRGAAVSTVLQRGFILGAIAWVGVGVAIHRLELQISPDPLADIHDGRASWEPTAPRTLRGPAGARLARSGAIVLAGFCLIGWAAVFAATRLHERRRGRGRRPDAPARPQVSQ